MSKSTTSGSLLFFFVKFLLLLTGLVYLWWQFLMIPYATLVAENGPSLFRFIFGHEGVRGYVLVDSEDILNTLTDLVFFPTNLAEEVFPNRINMCKLSTNFMVFIALVLATGGLKFFRRIWTLFLGTFILFLSQFAAIIFVYYMDYSELAKRENSDTILTASTAIEKFLLTLPFLLWIVLAYWQKLREYFASAPEAPQVEQKIELSGAKLLPDMDIEENEKEEDTSK